MNYSPELKNALLRRMLPPNNESITKISREEGISEQTFRNWRDKARKEGYAAPGMDAVPDDWRTQDKFLLKQRSFQSIILSHPGTVPDREWIEPPNRPGQRYNLLYKR